MGLRIIVKNADYSNSGLGKYVPPITSILTNGGITNPAYVAAATTLYNTLSQKGLITLFDTIKVMGFKTALADSIDWRNPQLMTSPPRSTFGGTDADHTINGYVSSGTGPKIMNTNYSPAAGMTNFHAHFWNTSPALQASFSLTIPGVFSLNRLNNVQTNIIFPTTTKIISTGLTSRTGLLSAAIAGTSLQTYDQGAALPSRAVTVPALASPTGSAFLGGQLNNGSSAYSGETYMFFGAGATLWTAQNETDLNNALSAFRTAMVAAG